MKINIRRFNKELSNESTITKYEVNNTNLLKALIEIKEEFDSSLSFRCGCKSGVCGSCAVKVNGVERLACKVFIKENDLIEPLRNLEVIKDLVVNVSHETFLINKTKSYINKNSNKEIKQENIEKIDLQSNCILCNSCFSSCPVYDVKDSFIGPFALSRALRYVNDEKLESNEEIISSIQTDGIWDCTLCSACTLVCPQGIDPKADIMQLQNISVQKGYTNPNFQNFSFDFNDDFGGGFNPNGF
ncbi:MAG: 2Fe-2S iron-sulfur cluster-binding protein [Arcobacter sp.]|jgi:fumarate reductase iron-sulfur subunit|uniref:succinate dehydrogenase/fumarate reductase iron-sulfur subunit n=1 Tax=Arcobacter sp. TaxID=1872629 RepID=UPI00258F2AE2|nr:2Fe-2S iron-sulfur cluster-binding protein [Arcobacter sp.]MDD3007415.1 2Fe-2S iron-sulfur cluster-binding protein [Arcobacter sp.]MDY3204557.1 2Fe-2S iron-sulfur cluster-binding protein [Arcobacter sp.]